MSKAPLFVMIGSGIVIVISLMIIGFGGVAIVDIDVESNAIFQGSSGSVPVEEYGTYTILVNDQYRCDETTVSITDGTTEFFISECDRTFDEIGWRAIGVMETNLNGELSVSANHEIIIVDDCSTDNSSNLLEEQISKFNSLIIDVNFLLINS